MKKRVVAIFAFVWLGAIFVNAAEGIEEAAVAMSNRLAQASAERAQLQEQIASEKIPMIKERNNLEAEVIALRQAVEKKESLKNGKADVLKAAEKELKSREDEVNYVAGLLTDYARNFETRIHIAEMQRYHDAIEAAKSAGDNSTLDAGTKFDRQLPLIETSLERVQNLLGGDTFKGRALVEDGTMATGKIMILGPVGLFASDDGKSAGLVSLELKSPEPSVVDPGSGLVGDVKKLVANDSGTLPLDPSLGNARKIAATKDTLIGQWKKGGPVMIPILLLGFVSLIVGVLKWLQVGRIRKATARDVQVVLEQLRAGHKNAAMEHAARIGGPSGEMLKRAVEHSGDDKELIEEVLYEQMLDTRPRLEKMMPLIALTAATAPLLGLLGTVTGMINTFNLISVFGTGDPRMLSSGISEALITTEYGLIVAIPALLIHAVVSRQTKGLLGSMEQAAVAFINGIPSRKENKA
ncbi:hypothetical protein GC207_15625 [bacterium]|nr:hypothetical protein [bacterium]